MENAPVGILVFFLIVATLVILGAAYFSNETDTGAKRKRKSFLSPTHCTLCNVPFVRIYHAVVYKGVKHYLCPSCESSRKIRVSKNAFKLAEMGVSDLDNFVRAFRFPSTGHLDYRQFKQHQIHDHKGLVLEPTMPVGLIDTVVKEFSIGVLTKDLSFVFMPYTTIHNEETLLSLTGLNHNSVKMAISIVGKMPVENIEYIVVENAMLMIERTVTHMASQNVNLVDGNFNDPISHIITKGRMQYLCDSSIWHVSVMDGYPTKEDLFKLILCYVMANNSNLPTENVTQIGIFNPRHNTTYTLRVADIGEDVLFKLHVLATEGIKI